MDKKYSQFENEKFKEQVSTIMNDGTIEWIQSKSKDFFTTMSYYKCAMMELETKFNVLNEQYSLENDRNPIVSIKTRLKSPESIKAKLEKMGFELGFENIESKINDIAGIRVVCSFIEDVYSIANALLMQDDITVLEKKDYIKNPKDNGYRSLHMIVSIPIFLDCEKREMKVEIQLRTIAMDVWASLEHQIRYKKEEFFPPELTKDLYECAKLSASLDEKMSDVRKKVIEKSYIIKPKKRPYKREVKV